MGAWIGVDLDGTLAEYHGWQNNHGVGEPIPAMVERVKKWIAEGKEVKIFTARVSLQGGYSLESHSFADNKWVAEQTIIIQEWCLKNIGTILPVVCMKDFQMIELWDDRCIHVEENTGRILG
jgi:hypothetical protein